MRAPIYNESLLWARPILSNDDLHQLSDLLMGLMTDSADCTLEETQVKWENMTTELAWNSVNLTIEAHELMTDDEKYRWLNVTDNLITRIIDCTMLHMVARRIIPLELKEKVA